MSATASRRGFELAAGVARNELRPKLRVQEGADRYRRDPLAHLDDGHVVIEDLVSKDEVPFLPWPHQRELAAAWVDVEHLAETGAARWRNVHEEKSRQEGITWLLAWLDLWALAYHPANGLVVHLEFEKVDDGGSRSTTESYFGKIRYMWERLPDRYRPPLFFKYGRVINSIMPRAFLVAEGADREAGRGGRYNRGVLDEAAKIPYGESVHASLARAIPDGRIYNSTPHGEDNVYARLRRERPAGYVFLTHHWSEHPVYSRGVHVAGEDPGCGLCDGNRRGVRWNAAAPECHRYAGRATSPWYDAAVGELTDEQVAQELDIDYAGALSGRVYPEFSERVHVDEAGFGIDPHLPIEFSIDFGINATSVVFLQDAPAEVRAVGEVEVFDNATPDVVTDLMRQELERLGVPERLTTPEWTLQTISGVGDVAGESRTPTTGRPLTAEYRKLGFRIVSRRQFVDTTIVAVKRLLNGRPKPFVISGPDCPTLVEHFKANRWPTDPRTGQRKINAREPLNDRHNHMLRGLAYWVTYRFPPPRTDESLTGALAVAEPETAASSGRVSTDARFDVSF